MSTYVKTSEGYDNWKADLIKQEEEYKEKHNIKRYCIFCDRLHLDPFHCSGSEDLKECQFEFYNICIGNERIMEIENDFSYRGEEIINDSCDDGENYSYDDEDIINLED